MNRFACTLALLTGLAAPAATLFAGVTLVQADGNELVLTGPAERLVTLSPNLAELVFAAGAGPALKATVDYSNFPQEAADLPRVGDAFRLDIERIVALRPDLVIAWDSGTPKGAVAQLRSLGIPVWSVEIRAPARIADILSDIGRATAHVESAEAAAYSFRRQLDELEQQYTGVEPLGYFYQVDAHPLFTINGKHLISQGLALCGGRNIFADEPGLAFQASHEAVIVADPDALIAPSLPGGADPFERWREWPNMQAIQVGGLIILDADRISRATPRWLESIESACTLLDALRK